MPSFTSALPYDTHRVGAVAIYCSDGRYNEQFDDFLHHKLNLPHYDRLTVPGGAGCLAGHVIAHRGEVLVSEALTFLINHHALTRVVLIAHQNCGYYLKHLMIPPATLRATQEEDLHKSAAFINRQAPKVQVETYFASIENGAVRIDPV